MAGRRRIGRHWMRPGTTGLPWRCNAMYFAGDTDRVGAERLAVYVREAERRLAAEDQFDRAKLAFPDPEQVFLRA